MSTKVRLGISTCPNDTYAFHGLMERQVDWRGLDFQVELLDIQQLNQRLHADTLDVVKASFHAALRVSDRTCVLPSGSALGFGVGPLLLAAGPDQRPTSTDQLTLCPGRDTTAMLLFELFHPETTRIEQVLFSDIMPRLQEGSADFGVCIHEGRFTWSAAGLHLVEDLGQRWESATGCPLPLGGIFAFERLGEEVISRVQMVIRDSLDYAHAHPELALRSMRRYAQEFDDRVLMQHVELYVNDWTLDLGETGAQALEELSRRARSIGLLAADSRPLRIHSSAA